MSSIISLKTENTKRLQAVHITPQGNVVVIGGKNGAGKSSVLDAIEWALAGDPSAKMPVRRGQEKSRTVIEIGDPGKPPELVVKRTFTAAGGTSLVVTNADGAKQMSPQTILDKLVGRLTFDPLAFARQKPQQQAETMRALVGLDFKAHDAAHDKLFDERTAVNRDAKALESRIAGTPKHADLPEAESSTAEILAEQQVASESNAANKQRRDNLSAMQAAQDEDEGSLAFQNGEVDRLKKELGEAEQNVKNIVAGMNARAKTIETEIPLVEALVDTDLSTFQTRAASVEQTNAKIRSNKQRAELVTQLRAKTDEAEKMTSRLEKMDADKRDAITKAKYTVDGLLFDATGGIVLNGIPFEQSSSAEQLRVSAAVGFALNPTLRVLIVRDGSLLDDESMALLEQMATEAKAQIWMERVGTDAHTSVVIEDGHVQGVEPVVEPVVDTGVPPDGEIVPPQPKPESEPAKKPSKLKRGQESLL